MKLCFLLAVLATARKLVDVPRRGKLTGIDLDGMEAMVLQLGSEPSIYADFRKLLREELLPRLRSEKGTATTLLDDAAKGFQRCPGLQERRIDALVAQHRLCRLEEQRFEQTRNEACNASQGMVQLLQQNCKAFEDLDVFPQEVPLVCNKAEGDASHEAHAKRVRDFYAAKLQELTKAKQLCDQEIGSSANLDSSCKAARDNHVAQRESCNQVQRRLDDMACEAWTEHAECEDQKSCLSLARQRYLDANRTGAGTEAELKTQWRAVQRIGCLLDSMENSVNTSEALETCRKKSHDASPMSLSYPFYEDWLPKMPDITSCSKPSFPPPGSEGYAAALYDLGPSPKIAACTAECCGECRYFTCSQGTVLKSNAAQLFGSSQEACCQPAPDPHWKVEDWPLTGMNCSSDCGLEAVIDIREALCWDRANGVALDAARCGEKPLEQRIRCPATPSCNSCAALNCAPLQPKAVQLCRGTRCTIEECCDRPCAVSDCPTGYVLKPGRCSTCSVSTCCSKTMWSFRDWAPSSCDQTCGRPKEMETRRVLCTTVATAGEDPGEALADDDCGGVKPSTSRVRCPETPACATWAYAEWTSSTVDCASRGCGLRELGEERAVVCNDVSNGARLPDERCPGAKPETHRLLCPATVPCVQTTSFSTTLPPTTAPEAKGQWVAPAWSTPDCSQRCCGLGALTEKRPVQCMDCHGQLLPDCSCEGPKPEASAILCPATAPCPVATSATTTPAPIPTTTKVSSPMWVYTDWPVDTANCTRGCGQGAVVQERAVVCNDLASGQRLPDASCSGPKPESSLTLCPASPPCATTTVPWSSLTCCPSGYVLKKAEVLPVSCQQGLCEVGSCCSMVSWVSLDWDDTQECDRSCGLPEQMQERSVTCQAMYNGEVVSASRCLAAAPAAKRRRCAATRSCESCEGVACGDDALAILPAPSCQGSTCNRERCCRKFLSGFHLRSLPLTPNTVLNEGLQGGTLRFTGVAPKLADGGHSFRLMGRSSMELEKIEGQFTAFVYLKPHLADGGAQDVLAGDQWKLSMTPLKQFQIRSLKEGAYSLPSSCTCSSIHEDVWTHIMVRDDGTALQLLVNGKRCCDARSAAASLPSQGAWLGRGLQANLHSVELWKGALADEEAANVTKRYHGAVASWQPLQQLQCSGAMMELPGIESLAECKVRCEDTAGCRSVSFGASCILRDSFASPAQCLPSLKTLVANYDRGCRKVMGAFDWRISLQASEAVTELAFLGRSQEILKAKMFDHKGELVDPSCALSDGDPGGEGCKPPPPTGHWEYRFSQCLAPSFLTLAVKEGDPQQTKFNVSFSTSSGVWKSCRVSALSGRWSRGRFRLSCFPAAPVAESPWWEH